MRRASRNCCRASVVTPAPVPAGESFGRADAAWRQSEDARVLLPQLPAIADLCLELLARVKATRVDAVTGLATENVLYGSMEDEVSRRCRYSRPSTTDRAPPAPWLCMGLVLLHFSNGREIVGRMGFRFADELMRRAAEALQRSCRRMWWPPVWGASAWPCCCRR